MLQTTNLDCTAKIQDAETVKCEKFLTLKSAADALGVPYCAIRRAVKDGNFPTYRFGGHRTRVRLSEVISAIETMACGRGRAQP